MTRLANLILLLFLLVLSSISAQAEPQRFAEVTLPAPIFSTPLAASTKPKPDRCGQIRSLEFIAFPGTLLTLAGTVPGFPDIIQVTAADYPTAPGTTLYLHRSRVKFHTLQPEQQSHPMPGLNQIRASLLAAVGLPYVWGGNLRTGLVLHGATYFKGVDCSGLLYEATHGATPRNTRQLVHFGEAVPVAGLTQEQIISRLQPLDLLVWDGHVVIVLDRSTAIESILNCTGGKSGVITTPLSARLRQILSSRTVINQWPEGSTTTKKSYVTIRRWFVPTDNQAKTSD